MKKKGMIAIDKTLILILVVLVILVTCLFIFRVNIGKWLSYFPAWENNTEDKLVDFSKISDQLAQEGCTTPIAIAKPIDKRKYIYIRKSDTDQTGTKTGLYFDSSVTKLYFDDGSRLTRDPPVADIINVGGKKIIQIKQDFLPYHNWKWILMNYKDSLKIFVRMKNFLVKILFVLHAVRKLMKDIVEKKFIISLNRKKMYRLKYKPREKSYPNSIRKTMMYCF